MSEKTYIAVRRHLGDKTYNQGDERVADPNEVRHLIPNVLMEKSEYLKAQKTKKASPAKKAK